MRIGAVVLNDIGPVIEREGLARIVAYVGRVPLPADWKEATELVYEMNRRQFTAVPAEEWADIARQLFNDDNGLPAPVLRPQARQGDLGDGRPDARAVAAVRRPRPRAGARHPRRELRHPEPEDPGRDAAPAIPGSPPFTVRGQGHAPLLRDAPTIGAIAGFLARTDGEAYASARAVA